MLFCCGFLPTYGQYNPYERLEHFKERFRHVPGLTVVETNPDDPDFNDTLHIESHEKETQLTLKLPAYNTVNFARLYTISNTGDTSLIAKTEGDPGSFLTFTLNALADTNLMIAFSSCHMRSTVYLLISK